MIKKTLVIAVITILELRTWRHRQAFGFPRTQLSLLCRWMMTCAVSLKINLPNRGRVVKISKVMYLFWGVQRNYNDVNCIFLSSRPPVSSSTLSPPTLPVTHFGPAIVACLLFPECTRACGLAVSCAWKALP